MYAMGNKTKTRNFDNDFLSQSDCENNESVVEVNSSTSFVIPQKVLKRRQKFWEQFFLRYSDQFTDDSELDIITLKPCKSQCRPPIRHKPRSVIQHWVNTGYLPYQISVKKVDYIKSIDPDTGKPNINYMKPCYDGSSLSSSVDTATYILQNINTTTKEKRMAIMGEAKPHNSTNFCDISHCENAEITQTANDKIYERNAKNNINNNNDTNNHSRCLITSDILLRPLQQKTTDLKENIMRLNEIVSTNGPLFNNSKSYSGELLNKSCESSNNKTYEIQSDAPYELPNKKSCELSNNGSCELLSNKSCELLNNKSCELPNNKSCELPNNVSCELPNNKSCELPNNKSCELPNNKSCELPNNKSYELLNNKSCEIPSNKSCELPNNTSHELPNNKSSELLNDMSCELSKIQSTSMYSKQSYLEKSLLKSGVTKMRHRKKLYTGRNSPVDLVTMKNCNKQVLCKLQQHIHPALDFGYSLPNKLSSKRKRRVTHSCLNNKNLTNVSQVISRYKRCVQTENTQNYFNLLHTTLVNQSIITNNKDDNKKNELNTTTVNLEKIGSKARKKSNNTVAQSENLKSIAESTKSSRNNNHRCTKKSNKLMENLENSNPVVLLTKLSSVDMQKYKKFNNFLHNLNPVIRLRRLTKFDIQKYKKSTNIMKKTKYLNAIVSLEKLSETAIKRYKTTLNMKKYSETNLLSSPSNVINITFNDTDSDQSTVLMYRCNSKSSDNLSTSNVSVFSKNNSKFSSPFVQTCTNNSLKTAEINKTLTFKDVQSEKSIDNTLNISTDLQNNLCSTLSHKSTIVPKNTNNDNAHTTSDKKIKLSSSVETSDTDDALIKPGHCLRSRNSQDNMCSTLSRESKRIPKNSNNDNAHATNDKKMKLSSTLKTSDTDDVLIKPGHCLRSRNLQDNICSTLSRESKRIPKNSNNDNAHAISGKKMKLSSTVETSDTDDALIKPGHCLRSRNSQDNMCSTLSRESKRIPKNSNNDNAHVTNDKKMKLSSTLKTSDTDDVLIKPGHCLRSRNLQDNICSTLSRESKRIPKNSNNDNAHAISGKKMKLSSTVETSDTDDALIKPGHYLRSRNLQDNICSTLSRESKRIPKNSNNDNVHATSDKKISSTVKTSDTDDVLIKPRHCLRSRNAQDNICSTLSRESKRIPNDNNNDNVHTTTDKKMKLSFTIETSDTADSLINPRHRLKCRKTINAANSQGSNKFNNLNTTKPCRESGRLKPKMEDIVGSQAETSQHNTKFRKGNNNHDINYLQFETNLFELSSDSDFTSSTSFQ